MIKRMAMAIAAVIGAWIGMELHQTVTEQSMAWSGAAGGWTSNIIGWALGGGVLGMILCQTLMPPL